MVIFKMELIGTVQNILNSNGQSKFSLIGWIKLLNPNQFLYGVTWMKVKRDVIVYYQSQNGAFHQSPNISKCKMIRQYHKSNRLKHRFVRLNYQET